MSKAPTVIGKGFVMIVNSIVNVIVLTAIVLLTTYGGYALWDSNRLYEGAFPERFIMYKPTVVDQGMSFDELREINPDVFSWLTVYGTNIDYPVTQYKNNEKYVITNVLGKYSASGSIFLDYQNSPDFSDFNSILYGHHMEKNAMFGDVGLFANVKYFSDRQYGNLYFDGKDHGLEFFAFAHTDAYNLSIFSAAVKGSDAQQAYLDNLLTSALHTRDIGVTTNDNIVLLTTCSSSTTNGRDVLAARISDETFPNNLVPEEEPANEGLGDLISRADYVPLWISVGLLLALLMFILLLLFKKKRYEDHNYDNDLSKDPDEQADDSIAHGDDG